MLTLRRCCLPGGVDRSEGVRNTTIHLHIEIEKGKEAEKKSCSFLFCEYIFMRVYAAAVKRRTPCRVHSCMIEHALRAMQFRRRLALQEMGCCSSPFFLIIYLNFLSISKKREMLPHECSKELQEARTPPLCRCTEEYASKRNPHWRAGYSSRSYAKFLRRQYIYKIVCVYGESVLLLQQA